VRDYLPVTPPGPIIMISHRKADEKQLFSVTNLLAGHCIWNIFTGPKSFTVYDCYTSSKILCTGHCAAVGLGFSYHL
jgi:hypothetical protein